jgi:hypothetical protein
VRSCEVTRADGHAIGDFGERGEKPGERRMAADEKRRQNRLRAPPAFC